MSDIQLFFFLAPLAGGLCLLALAHTLARRRRLLSLAGLLFCSLMILSGHVLELGSGAPERILFFSRFTYAFIAFCPVFWFLFSLELSLGRKNFMWRSFLFLALLPIATTCIVWTNPVHHLLWREWTYRRAGEFLVLVVRRYGNWFWVHFAYSYALYLVGIALIVRAFFRQHRMYRIQSYWVLAGGILPLLSNLVYVLRLFGPNTKDFTPLVVAMSGALFTVGIRKCALASISPLPRDEVYMRLDFPVVVLDPEKRIMDFNDAASRVLVTESALGKRLDGLLAEAEKDFPSRETLLAGHAAVSWQEGGVNIRGEARVQFLLAEKGKPGGYCVTFFARKAEGEALPPLSRREREILTLVILDLTNKEIAERLFITESTVKSHIHRLLKKAGVDKREALRALAEVVSSDMRKVGA